MTTSISSELPPQLPTTAAQAYENYSLLIIDDNPTNLRVMVDYLATYGFEIMVARNGNSGIRRAKYAVPDLILLDVKMPGIDGFETCRRLKADPQVKDVPVIFMTALTSTEDKVQGFAVGAVDYITKPIRHEEALARISTHLTIRDLQKKLLQANKQLEEANNKLEARVIDRTYRLQVMTTLNSKLNEIRQLDQLLSTLVGQLKGSFAYYHVKVYLFNQEHEKLALVASSGQPMNKIKLINKIKQIKRIEADPSHDIPPIVNTVARSKRYFLANNVAESDTFIRDPLFPRTRSLLAIPIRLGQRVIGVLDIHSKHLNHFTTKDISMLQSIADGAAIAIDNARLLSEREATILKLQELDRAKSEFLGVVSHELRTPINAIIGFAEMLLVGIYGELPQEAHKMIHGIYTRGENMVGLINNLLDMTQIEAGQFNVILSEVDDVDMMITETIATLETQVGDRPVEIIADLPDELPSVLADRRRLQQIFLNLGTNAVKFTDQGSVEIKASVEGNHIRFSVIDTGTGIPPEKQRIIFDKFKRADMSQTRQRGGLGLGLAICKELIQMHNGKLGLKSQVGVGSEFYFTIPLAL